MGFTDGNVNTDNEPISFLEACGMRILQHHQELAQKEEDSRQKFVLRVKETEAGLKQKELRVNMIKHKKQLNMLLCPGCLCN